MRQEFIQSILTQLMNCTNEELSELHTKVTSLCECVQTRCVVVHGMEPVKLQWSSVSTDLMNYRNKTITILQQHVY